MMTKYSSQPYVDRSYLPWRSARMYKDRRMKKWMGFFLSEHTASLNEEHQYIDWDMVAPKDVLITQLSQAYLARLPLNICLRHPSKKDESYYVEGLIDAWNPPKIGIRADDRYQWVQLEEILHIELIESSF